jgi:hypothetical protein
MEDTSGTMSQIIRGVWRAADAFRSLLATICVPLDRAAAMKLAKYGRVPIYICLKNKQQRVRCIVLQTWRREPREFG